MPTANEPHEASPAGPLGLGARFLGIVTSPRETFERVVAAPRWIGMLALGVGVVAGLSSAFLSMDFAQRELLDQQVSSMEAFGVTVTDEVYAELERRNRTAPYTTLGTFVLGVPIVCAVVAGLLYGAGHGFLGAKASFAQVFAVVVHAGPVFVVAQLFSLPINYARESITSPATLAAFAPLLDDETFVHKLLSTVDLFHVWWVMILSIGLAVLWQRRTAPIATTLYGIHAAIVLIIAVLRTNLGF